MAKNKFPDAITPPLFPLITLKIAKKIIERVEKASPNSPLFIHYAGHIQADITPSWTTQVHQLQKIDKAWGCS